MTQSEQWGSVGLVAATMVTGRPHTEHVSSHTFDPATLAMAVRSSLRRLS
jgi:hypothetical protein